MKINEISTIVEMKKSNIRYYEKAGLITPARDVKNGYRVYTDKHVEKLKLIKLMRKLGISIKNIERLLTEKMTLTQALQSHLQRLDDQIDYIEQSKCVAKKMLQESYKINQINAEKLLNLFQKDTKPDHFLYEEELLRCLPESYKLKYVESIVLDQEPQDDLIAEINAYFQKLLYDSFSKEKIIKRIISKCAQKNKSKIIKLIKE